MIEKIRYSYLKYKNISCNSLLELGYFSVLWGEVEYYYFAKINRFNNNGTICNYITTDSKNEIENLAKNIHSVENAEFFNDVKNIKEELLSYFKNQNITNNDEIIKKILVEPHKANDKIYLSVKNIIENKIEERGSYDNLLDSPIMGALSICYRIRNNLFHGNKEPLTLNSQKGLFEAINLFLNRILETIKFTRYLLIDQLSNEC